MVKLYHVVAMAGERVIGKDNQLPWHFPADLKHFKELTSGSTVIMGRKTYESIGRPLPNRENFILSRNEKSGLRDGVIFFNDFEEALKKVETEKVFVIGGANIYEQTLDKVDGIYATMIDAEYEGDAFYPEIPSSFQEVKRWTLQSEPKIEAIFYGRSIK